MIIRSAESKKKKISDSHCHNFSELYSVFVQARFTTSKTKLDIQYNKLWIRVALGGTEGLKT